MASDAPVGGRDFWKARRMFLGAFWFKGYDLGYEIKEEAITDVQFQVFWQAFSIAGRAITFAGTGGTSFLVIHS